MLSGDQWNKIREAVASHPDCPPKTLRKLAQDRNVKVRGQVAAHPKCPPTQLEMLALDRFERVRKTVACNPNCPSQSQSRLHKEFGRQYCRSEFVCGSQQAAGSAGLYQIVHPLRELTYWSDEGDPAAQVYLSRAYEHGRKVPKDHELAIKWYAKAAEQGNAEAQASLGFEYEWSRPEEAIRWYRLAAEQGNSDAELGLGLAFEEGRGVAQDYVQAVQWFRKAIDHGNDIAKANLGFAYQHGRGVRQDFDKAEELYVDCLDSESAHSFGDAERMLGDLYRDHANPNKDDEQAFCYYRQAAERGDVDAQISLGNMFRDGAADIETDYEQALHWYLQATKQKYGPPEALLRVAEGYERGLGVSPDFVSAYMYYLLAETRGLKVAKESLTQLAVNMSSQEIASAQDLAVQWQEEIY